MTDRHECPDCGHSHRPRAQKSPAAARSQATNTDLEPGRCGRCNAVIIRGRVGGLDTVCEPQPLNQLGWQTYAGIGRSLYLRRGLRATFAGPQSRWPPPPGRDFHLEHICGKPIPDVLFTNNVVREKETADEFPDTPPF
ncbi:hypothetical protein [Gordonia terrae]